MGELLRRFHYPLTYLFLALLCLVSMSSRTGPTPLPLGSQLVLELTTPLQRMVTFPVREVSSLWDNYVALVEVREKLAHTSSQLAREQREHLQCLEAIVASERFSRVSAFQAQGEVPMVPSNVVAQDLSDWFQSVIIDQGSSSGVRPGMPVVSDSGLVGVVAGTTLLYAKVLLVTDPQTRIDAYVQRSRARGTVHGAGEGECDFENVLRDADLKEGDLVLTSGLGSIYPKGLVVGTVSKVERKPYGLFQSAEIEPAVAFRQLEEVFVILERRELPDDEEFSLSDPGLWIESDATGPEPR